MAKKISIDELFAAARASDGAGEAKPRESKTWTEDEWEVESDGRCEHYSCEALGEGDPGLFDAFAELWRKVGDVLESKVPDDAWKVIYVELWYDSGRIIVYPNKQPPDGQTYAHQRDEPVCFTVEATHVEMLFDDFVDKEENESDFDSSAALQQHLLPMIAGGIGDSLDALRAKKDFTIYWFEYNGEDGVHELADN